MAEPLAAEAESRYFAASDGIRLHYLSAGPPAEAMKPTLVFIPGWSMPASIWSAQTAHFAGTHRVIAFDPRSQGKSEVALTPHTPERRAQDIAELLDHLGLRGAAAGYVLVGWSLGVLETLTFSATHGHNGLRGVVLVDNSVGEDPPPAGGKSNFLQNLRTPAKRRATVDGFVRSMFRTPQKPAYLDAITTAAMRMPPEAAVQLLSQPYPRTFWRDAVYALRVPVLYAVTPKFEGQALNLQAKHPKATVAIFADAGHALFVDAPGRFNDLLGQFVAGVEGGTR